MDVIMIRTAERTTVRMEADKWHRGPYAVVVNTGNCWGIFYASTKTKDKVLNGLAHAAGEDTGYTKREYAEEVAEDVIRSLIRRVPQQGIPVEHLFR